MEFRASTVLCTKSEAIFLTPDSFLLPAGKFMEVSKTLRERVSKRGNEKWVIYLERVAMQTYAYILILICL